MRLFVKRSVVLMSLVSVCLFSCKKELATPEVDDSLLLGGEGAYANCYMIQDAGKYKIEAKRVDGSLVENIESADWIWSECDQNPQGLLSEVSYSEGVIRFTAAAQRGNAVIGAFDADGKVLWSWHIWNSDAVSLDQVDNGTRFMDRNLGARSNNPADVALTYGLKYQWGRKDPFYGGAKNETVAFSQAEGNVIFNDACDMKWGVVLSSAETGTVDFATANPTTFIYSEVNDVKDWMWVKNSYLWETKNTEAKTIYDPCPAGYQVPADNAWKGVRYDNTHEKDGGKEHTTEAGNKIWWPLCGTRWGDRDAGILDYVYEKSDEIEGGQGIYWKRSTNMTGTNAGCLYLLNGSYTDAGHGMYRAHGCAVRCEYIGE